MLMGPNVPVYPRICILAYHVASQELYKSWIIQGTTLLYILVMFWFWKYSKRLQYSVRTDRPRSRRFLPDPATLRFHGAQLSRHTLVGNRHKRCAFHCRLVTLSAPNVRLLHSALTDLHPPASFDKGQTTPTTCVQLCGDFPRKTINPNHREQRTDVN